jgi:hypothetical protein
MKCCEWPANAVHVSGVVRRLVGDWFHVDSPRARITVGQQAQAAYACAVMQVDFNEKQGSAYQIAQIDSHSDSGPFARVHAYHTKLTQLNDLHNKFDLKLSFADYVLQSNQSVAFMLLDRVQVVQLRHT